MKIPFVILTGAGFLILFVLLARTGVNIMLRRCFSNKHVRNEKAINYEYEEDKRQIPAQVGRGVDGGA
jgi:hypothetical protein